MYGFRFSFYPLNQRAGVIEVSEGFGTTKAENTKKRDLFPEKIFHWPIFEPCLCLKIYLPHFQDQGAGVSKSLMVVEPF